MTAKKTEVAKKAEDQLPAAAGMFEEDAGHGFESTTKDDYAIPFLQALQKMSPQVDPEEDGFIEGAKPGQIVNTVSEELWDGKTGVVVIPCHYERKILEWVPRNKGGGLVAEHDLETGLLLLDECIQDEQKRDIHPGNGNEFQDTRIHYVMVVGEDGSFEPAVISMTRTKIRGSKKWMSLMNGIKMRRKDGGLFTPPMFSHAYRIFTEARSNDQGTFYVFNVKKERQLGSEEGDTELYQAAKGFRETVQAGKAKANMANADGGTGTGNAEPNDFAD
jgi:hypothetical protein